jgi:hypothetical protein
MNLHRADVAAAELRVVQSGEDMRTRVDRLRAQQSAPQGLVFAVAAGVLLGFFLGRRTPVGTLADLIGSALIRHGVNRLIASADVPSDRIA